MRGSVALTPNRKELTSRERANEPRIPRPHPRSVSLTPETSTSFAMPARGAPRESRDQVCVEMSRCLNCRNRIRDGPHLLQSQEWIDLRDGRPECLDHVLRIKG